MTDLLQIDVAKTIKKIPLSGVQDILVISVMQDNSLKCFTTMNDADTLDTILDAELIYDDDSSGVKFEMDAEMDAVDYAP